MIFIFIFMITMIVIRISILTTQFIIDFIMIKMLFNADLRKYALL